MLPYSANTSGKGFRPTGEPQRTPAPVILVFFNLNFTSHATKPMKLQRYSATLAKWAKQACTLCVAQNRNHHRFTQRHAVFSSFLFKFCGKLILP